ncbi:EAL domain-containing protein [soil metagenome]
MNVSHLSSDILILVAFTILGLALLIALGNKRREVLLRRYDLILNNGLDCVITLDHKGRVVEFNPAAEKTFGYPKANVLGKNLAQLIIPPALREEHRCCGITHCVATGEEGVLGRRIEITALRADGSEFPVELAVTRILLDGLPFFSAHLRDITDRRAAENSLREARGRLDHLLASSPSIIYSTGATAVHRCTFVSRNLLETLGYAPEEMIADPEFWFAHLHPEDRATVLAHFAQEVVPERGSIEYRFRHADGSYRWFHDSYRLVRDEAGPAEVVGSWTDITARKAAEETARSREERIHYLAYHDALTDLPNRSLLLDRLSQALAQAERDSTQVAVLFTDLDRFKIVNDTLGHPAGDELLRQVAQRLRSALREGDTLARLSGDEFVILLPRISGARDVARVAAKALGMVTAPFTVLGHELHISSTIGVSLFPKDGADPETLLKHADTALYQAKDRGRNRYQFFDARMNAHAQKRRLLENGLRRAIEREEFVLHYQPQIDLQTDAVTGVEALIRWHPEQRMVRPREFIPIAEETGLIIEIGEWVLRTACRQAMEWEAAGLPPVRMAVNLSIRQLRRGDFPARVRALVGETGLPPQRLDLEITESSLMVDPEQIIKTLHELRGTGIQLAMDDFGAGYSSLAYLKRLPLDRIKIDRSFVRDIPEDPDDVAIVQAILAMARQLKIRVVAEGVETTAQARFLRNHGCQEAQGYAFGRPLPAEACADFLAKTPLYAVAGR